MPKSRPRRAAAAKIVPRAKIMRAALSHGRESASAVLEERGKTLASGTGQSGLLIAEGDSWFDYPGDDVLAILEDNYGYRVESVAHHGDTIESMAYDSTQLTKLARAFEHVKQDGREPRAILLSGGGNDIAGDEFAVLLNHAASGLPPLNPRVVEGILDERLRFAIGSVIGAVTELSQRLFGRKPPVLIHGYAHPVPDGRGYLGGFWFLPGPWLRPGFSAKGYEDRKRCCDIVEDLIDRFNEVVQSIAGSNGFEHVSYVDVRPLLSNELPNAYRKSWDNELHPTDAGYALIAKKFDDTIRRVAPLTVGGGPRVPRATTSGPSGKLARPKKAGRVPARPRRRRSR